MSTYYHTFTIDNEVIDGVVSTTSNSITASFISIPSGGDEGQLLSKASDDSYDVEWVDPSGASATDLSLGTITTTTVVVVSSSGNDVTLPAATISLAGLATAAQITKLTNIAAGATVNSTDAELRDRSTHTGTQLASTISDFTTASNILNASAIATHNAVTSAHGISVFGASLVDDADAASARTTLGLGTLATQSGTFSGTSSGTNTGDQTITLSGVVSGSGTGAITTSFGTFASSILASALTDETGTGSVVFSNSPTLVTPVLGVATATSINSTTIPSSKTLVVTTDKLSVLASTSSSELAGVISDETGSGSLVFATSPTLIAPVLGVATATSINSTTIPPSKTLIVTTDKLSALASTSSSELAGVISDETGSGALVFATSPVLVTPALGTPSAVVLTNATGTAANLTSGITQALKSATTTVDVSAATAPVVGQFLVATGPTGATWQYGGSYRPQIKSGRYLVPLRTSTLTSLTPGASTAYVCPVFVERRLTFSGLAFGVTSSNTNTSFSAHIGVYTDVNGAATSLVSGTETTGSFTPTTSTSTNCLVNFSGNVTLDVGWYWLCMQPSSITGMSLVAVSSSNATLVVGALDMITEGPRIGFSQAYGTLPGTAGTAVYSDNSTMIYLGLKLI